MIKLNSMVTLTIKDEPWIGEVMAINNGVALVKLMDNLHYHAKLTELKLFSAKRKVG